MKMTVLREAAFREEMDGTVSPLLSSVREDGVFPGYDGKELAFHIFRAENPVGNVVILHGFTESSEKYEEMSWYFFREGYSVFLYDQRGHGKSFRALSDKTLTHVERFEEYVSDLECFLEKVVDRSLPLFLFSHSMGGAVAALYMESHPMDFCKAVLSSPMIAPSTGGYPAFVGRAICRAMALFGKGKERIFLSREYPGEESFEDSCGSSRERFARYELFRRTHPDFRNFSPTYRWTNESLKVEKKILKKGAPERIGTEVLLLSAGKDDVVRIPPQREFARRVPSCRFVVYPEAKHEIFMSPDEVMDRFVPEVLSFFAGT